MTTLLVDTPNVAHRFWFGYARMVNSSDSPILFGILKDVRKMTQRFNINKIAFCFDSKPYLRSDIYPNYKNPRTKIHDYEGLYGQIRRLPEQLRELGFKNILQVPGAEADDLIAHLCLCRDKAEMVVIHSTDKDMFQLLGPDVTQYNGITETVMTEADFIFKYRVIPKRWPLIKAMVGCISDAIPGIEGVGDALAARYLNMENRLSVRIKQRIQDSEELIQLNLSLVTLPYNKLDLDDIKLVQHSLSRRHWDRFMVAHHFLPLLSHCPLL